jgi:chromosome segregation ATPase
MSDSVNPNPINSLDALVQAANQAADQLGKATRGNAIWDKASKSLKPGLATLAKVRTDAEADATLAEELRASLGGQYDSPASDIVRSKRTAIDKAIDGQKTAQSNAETALNQAKESVAQAKAALEESNAQFEAAQKKLLDLPKEIQDKQKQLVALKGEVSDAHKKHQLVEAVVKLADLGKAITDLKDVTKPEYESSLWQALNNAVDDLILKTEALPAAQAEVPGKETAFNEAKAQYEEAKKNRLDDIRKQVADQDGAPNAL